MSTKVKSKKETANGTKPVLGEVIDSKINQKNVEDFKCLHKIRF
jgi:hypothetical protein